MRGVKWRGAERRRCDEGMDLAGVQWRGNLAGYAKTILSRSRPVHSLIFGTVGPEDMCERTFESKPFPKHVIQYPGPRAFLFEFIRQEVHQRDPNSGPRFAFEASWVRGEEIGGYGSE